MHPKYPSPAAHLVLPDHPRVHLGQVPTVLVMVDPLAPLTLDQLSSYDPGLHGGDPGFSDMQVLLVQTLCVIADNRKFRGIAGR